MAYWLMLGALNGFSACLSYSSMWLNILGGIIALICFFMAWHTYRIARKIANLIDDYMQSVGRQLENYLELFKIIFNGEESESKGQGEKQAENEEPAACNDESEDEYAHPV